MEALNPAWKYRLLCGTGLAVTPVTLTIGHSRHLILQREDQLGLPSEVLAAALLMLQHRGDPPGEVVQAVDHRGVRVGLCRRQHATQTQQHTFSGGARAKQKLKPEKNPSLLPLPRPLSRCHCCVQLSTLGAIHKHQSTQHPILGIAARMAAYRWLCGVTRGGGGDQAFVTSTERLPCTRHHAQAVQDGGHRSGIHSGPGRGSQRGSGKSTSLYPLAVRPWVTSEKGQQWHLPHQSVRNVKCSKEIRARAENPGSHQGTAASSRTRLAMCKLSHTVPVTAGTHGVENRNTELIVH